MKRRVPMSSPEESPRPAAYSLPEIRLHDGVSRDTFEKFMLETLLPTVDTREDAADFGDQPNPDQHFLLQGDWPSEVYIWTTRVEYFVHHTPLPEWLFRRFEEMYEAAREPLAPFGTYTSEERRVFYDVASMGEIFLLT
jgi:hypothetical protein